MSVLLLASFLQGHTLTLIFNPDMASSSNSIECRWESGVSRDAPRSYEEAYSRIEELYNSGVPFFTKERIESLYYQLQHIFSEGDELLIEDITGAEIRLILHGKSRWIHGIDSTEGPMRKLLAQPRIIYFCCENLKRNLQLSQAQGLSYDPEQMTPLASLDIVQFVAEEPSSMPSKEAVTAHFRRELWDWRATETCRNLSQILDKNASRHSIKKVIALDLGSLSAGCGHRSPLRHALVVTLREWLQLRVEKAPCYFQDARNVDIDKEVLQGYGIETIDDPSAWLEVDDTTILFSYAALMPVKEMVADLAKPAVLIWEKDCKKEDVPIDSNSESVNIDADPYGPRIRAMLEGYEKYEFGVDSQFNSMVVYVRK